MTQRNNAQLPNGLMRFGRLCSFVLCIGFNFIHAQTAAADPYSYNSATHVFRLDSPTVTYAFGVNEVGGLQSIYWGGHLELADPLPQPHTRPGIVSFDLTANTTPLEFTGSGGGVYTEPALKVTFPDGNRDLVLKYVSHTITSEALSVRVKDVNRDVFVDLHYVIDGKTGIIARSASIENRTPAPIVVEQAASGNLNLPASDDYRLSYLTGRWAGEFTLQQRQITPGKTILESRRGSTGHQNSPWLAIERTSNQTEEHGGVWFGALAWSGSWSIAIEQDTAHQVRVTAGYNPFDFGYKLEPREILKTPFFYVGYTEDGLGGASRAMHTFERTKILPQAPSPRLRPVLYNSWEATEMDVDEAGQLALATKAASIGVERFVMDDGWFGQRKDDHAGLGDWYVNPKKFPNGLGPLIQGVHKLGMDFGLWVEPEMVNVDSDLYRKHPDWVLNFTGRPRSEGRNQLVLNLARADVRAYVFAFLDRLVTENDIAFLKWDYNRNWSEPGWPAVTPDEQKRLYVAYTDNLYSILLELRAKHPKLEIESCSGGGGRVDLGILALTDEVWTSDNTDPYDRLTIQNGFSHAYAPGVMMAWVTDSPSFANDRSTSLDYRFLVAMQGSLGVGANLNKWTSAEFATAKAFISDYKTIRDTVQHGSLYRLIQPTRGSEFVATEYVSLDKTRAVLFAYLHSSMEFAEFPSLRLLDLDLDRQYRLTALHGTRQPDGAEVASGRYWMQHGVKPDLRGDFKASAFQLTAE